MTNQPRGHLAATSRFQRTLTKSRRLTTQLEQMKTRLAELPAEIAALERRLIDAKREHAVEQQKVDVENYAALFDELGELLAGLDAAPTSAAERRVGEIFAVFRLARLSGQDARALAFSSTP